jgi:hypothetical protein
MRSTLFVSFFFVICHVYPQGPVTAGFTTVDHAGAGTHMITYTYTSNEGCTSSDSTPIVVYALPPAQPASSVNICGGTPVRITATGNSPKDTYSWTPALPLNDPTIAGPVATVDSTTTFIAQVTDSNGCSSYDTVTVNAPVSSKSVLAVPNSFTPNGDGHNDCFGIQRWGDAAFRRICLCHQSQVLLRRRHPYRDGHADPVKFGIFSTQN